MHYQFAMRKASQSNVVFNKSFYRYPTNILITTNYICFRLCSASKMSSFSMPSVTNTLLVATRTDPASINIANHLIDSFNWNKLQIPNSDAMMAEVLNGGNVYMWVVNEPLLHINHADRLFSDSLEAKLSAPITEIVFLSRHVAASGTLSLTVHPIGIPWLADASNSGGIPFKCSPPSTRISSILRSLVQETKRREGSNRYQVTLEATHHGPYVQLPACFVEIGSTENEWSDAEAGSIWAKCLGDEFLLPAKAATARSIEPEKESPSTSLSKKTVVVSIGGGHYVPKMNDLV